MFKILNRVSTRVVGSVFACSSVMFIAGLAWATVAVMSAVR